MLRVYLVALTPWLQPVIAKADSPSFAGDASWHAPSQTEINNLTSAINGTGTYGFIYNSSTTRDDQYGTYNWCNMPHVRRREYIKAPDGYELKYVELMHRHHKRTPYSSNAFPVESYHWDCDDEKLYIYGQPSPGQHPASAYRQGYISSVNPFIPSGWIGTCQFPQITNGGLQDSWQHGADLYDVYHSLLGLLPARSANTDYDSRVKYRVTNNAITSQVAGMVINGMWQTRDPVSLLIQADGIDSLEPQYPCPKANSLFSSIKSSSNPQWQHHLDAAAGIYHQLDGLSGVSPDDYGFHASFDHYYDNLSARQCHEKSLPCKLVDGENSTDCVSQQLADAVYRLGNWEYSQIYRDSPDSLLASAGSLGVWIGELTTHIREVITGKSEVVYFHNVAHDGSVSRLLSILQVDKMVWPGMGSEVVFELYKKTAERLPPTLAVLTREHQLPTLTDGEYYVRVLFGGRVLKSSSPVLGRMDMLPVGALLAYLDDLVGQGASSVKKICQGSSN
ncbi:hypothetical protein PT974_02727 [Cladobotryum mycophilum]|uniref:Acid phosphatase n=1 Tax=Cladobotryum mycophilum TaxID=491253 RepID=A0ABR0T034_9HYPO